MNNALSVDIEDWYDSKIDKGRPPDYFKNCRFNFEGSVCNILDFFAQNNVKATFFILGSIGQRYPELINRIYRYGHEIACHGLRHEFIYRQDREEFRKDINLAKRILEDASGARVLGFRAPSFSITKNSLWALEIIRSLGFEYDSSISPSKNYLYGIPDSPDEPYNISIAKEFFLRELPQTTMRFFGVKIPFCGGFFLRVFPYRIVKFSIESVNKNMIPANIYFHPHEMESFPIPARMLSRENIILNAGKKSLRKKIELLIRDFSFVPLREIMKEIKIKRVVSLSQLSS